VSSVKILKHQLFTYKPTHPKNRCNVLAAGFVVFSLVFSFKKMLCFDVATVTQNFQPSVRSLNSASAPTLSTLPLPALSMPSPCPLFALTLRLFALDPQPTRRTITIAPHSLHPKNLIGEK